MSLEVQIAHACPHLILEEQVGLGDDRRSLATRAPVASTSTVRVLANDEFFIPSGGLYSQAQITSDRSGPYRIVNCDTTITVQSSTQTATFAIPEGGRVSVADVVARFQQNLSSVAVEVIRGHLVLTDVSSVGTESSLLISGPGASSLGFSNQRGARGRQVYPPWELVPRDDTITNRYPRFRGLVKANPVFKVSYVTVPERCIRCGSRLIENDYRFDLTGDVLLIENENLLYQAALKILLTRIRSNPFHTFYGSGVESRIGAKAIGAVATLITEDVQKALSTMQKLQQEQTKYQKVSIKERLYTVSSVRVSPQASDPTVFLLDVVVSNAAGAPVVITIVFSVPGVVALSGTNGLSLGLETAGLSRDQAAKLLR